MTDKQKRLTNFLIEDVTKLVNLILESEEMQEIETPGTGFDTLQDFASYWSYHIKSLTD